jgi:hypothetical protein
MDQSADDPHAVAQRAADQLAIALEEIGFDVGQAFPDLQGSIDNGRAVVDLGRVTAVTAAGLADTLTRAVQSGIALPPTG